jgi:uncharacterized protein (TIGR02996 family)
MPVARNEALEAELAREPDITAPFLVHADWLQAQGDPRGELIAIQAGLADQPSVVQQEVERDHPPVGFGPLRTWSGNALAVANDALLATHRNHFLAPLLFKSRKQAPSVEWYCGYWRKLRFRVHYDLRTRARELLAQALAHPSARVLRELTVGSLFDDPGVDALPATLPPTLRLLYVGDFAFPDETELSWSTVGDVSGLYPRAPQLETLILQGGMIELGDRVELPQLRHLELITAGLHGESLRAIAGSALPVLERLIVWTGTADQGGDVALDDLRQLIGASFPKLRHLAIKNCAYADELIPLLLASPLLDQLRVLDLSLGTLTADGVTALEQGRDRLAHLERLDVSWSLLDAPAVERVRRLAREVHTHDQRPDVIDDPERYPAVGE